MGELRQNPITEKWVAIATERAKRPDSFSKEKSLRHSQERYKNDCPFCNLAKFPQEPDILRLPDADATWQMHIFQNKYPAFIPSEEFRSWKEGPYLATNAVGHHELLATRYHNQNDATVDQHIIELELEALVLRYRQLKSLPAVNYIQIIKNHGREAGASLEHPHHQIFSVPVLPSDIADLLHGTERYAKKHGEKAFTIILDYEREHKKRIVFENEYFTAFCPYASRVPFETWIMPRQSNPFFEDIGPSERSALAQALQQVLGKMYTGLNDPPYNYYIHSAPCDETGFVCDKSLFQHFRWHIAIMPRLSTYAGFELGTGIEINTMLPEDAAVFLREQSLPETIL
ncbi:MAG TPA: galactose-1-phosphate uridylyltransferase [Candidatus Andersenbacteria bacterium]|nr:galactose-1-phosphate uridylyltransferase [Candidatus Andersenbacteria bacterium]